MFDDETGTTRAVAWSEVCPWLSLFRCFGLAIRMRLLLLSAVAILLTVAGWVLLGMAFSGDEAIEAQVSPHCGCPWTALTESVPDRPTLPRLDGTLLQTQLGVDLSDRPQESLFERPEEPFWGSFVYLSRPVRSLFQDGIAVTELAFLLVCTLWTLAVWAFFAGAITRSVAVQLACDERITWPAMLRYARLKWRSYLTAPLMPLGFVLVVSAAIGAFGMLLWTDVGLLIAAIFWPMVLATEWFLAGILLLLAFGWPLMWAAISAEGSDCYDGLSRSFSYVYQRPLHYLFYVFVAVLLGLLGWIVVANFAAAVITLTTWAIDWGADTARWTTTPDAGDRRIDRLLVPGADLSPVGLVATALIRFWFNCLKLLAVGFLYSYFWTASTAIYFLLRQSADATELDEVFLEEEPDDAAYALPPITTDATGAPVVADDPASHQEANDSTNENTAGGNQTGDENTNSTE